MKAKSYGTYCHSKWPIRRPHRLILATNPLRMSPVAYIVSPPLSDTKMEDHIYLVT